MKISVFSRTPRSKALPELYSQGLLSTVSTNSPIFKKQCISQKIFLFESYPTLELSTQRMYFMTEQVIFITHSLSAIPMKKENTYLMLQKWRLLICNLWRLEHITYHTLISSFIKAIKKKKKLLNTPKSWYLQIIYHREENFQISRISPHQPGDCCGQKSLHQRAFHRLQYSQRSPCTSIGPPQATTCSEGSSSITGHFIPKAWDEVLVQMHLFIFVFK